jgi:hypothetical protein
MDRLGVSLGYPASSVGSASSPCANMVNAIDLASQPVAQSSTCLRFKAGVAAIKWAPRVWERHRAAVDAWQAEQHAWTLAGDPRGTHGAKITGRLKGTGQQRV